MYRANSPDVEIFGNQYFTLDSQLGNHLETMLYEIIITYLRKTPKY